MLIYYVSLIGSVGLLFLSNLFAAQRHFSNILTYIVPLPMAIVAGVRNLTIGTDVLVYGNVNFYFAGQFSNLIDYIKFVRTLNGVEIGYSLLNFVVSRFSDSTNVFLFVLNYFTLMFVILALRKIKNYKYEILGLIIYFGFFWGNSLNAMRQSLAASIVLLAVANIIFTEDVSYKQPVLLILFASLFHQTALFALVLILIWFLIKKYKTSFLTLVLFTFVIGSLMLVLVASPQRMMAMFEALPFLSKYYSIFQSSGAMYLTSGGGMAVSTILERNAFILVLMILSVISKRTNFVEMPTLELLSVATILDFVFLFVGVYSGLFARLGLYFSMVRVLSAGYFISRLGNVMIKFVLYIFVVFISLYVFYLVTHSGSGQIYPYVSDILNDYSIF